MIEWSDDGVHILIEAHGTVGIAFNNCGSPSLDPIRGVTPKHGATDKAWIKAVRRPGVDTINDKVDEYMRQNGEKTKASMYWLFDIVG